MLLQLRLDGVLPLFNNWADNRANAAVDPNRDVVAVLEVDWRLLDPADALRSPGHDDRAREQCGALREEGDGLPYAEELVTKCIPC